MAKGKIKLTLSKYTSSLKIQNIVIAEDIVTYDVVVDGEDFNGYIFITIDAFSNIKRSTASDTNAGSLSILSTESSSHKERTVPITIPVGSYSCSLELLTTLVLNISNPSEVEASVGYSFTPDISSFIDRVVLNSVTEPI